ncbi:MAG: tripartite tricarboxylate transporter substrate binding protein [Spirochaetes bacterium]|nr:MAG: tripartite tricarboxylate transporter substrate binding protein [Spirochaetota bacterium]
MKKTLLILVLILTATVFMYAEGKKEVQAQFPTKPINLIVYTKPGGLIDVTSRKVTDIASKYTKATFVVINKPGAGGIVAMKYVLATPADGYTLMAVTKSNVAKVVSTGADVNLMDLNWMDMLMADPECVITNKKLSINTWDQLIADAKAKNGNQLWVGPAAGGLDNVVAMKIWKAFDIKVKWVPFASGGKAMAALLGGQGVAYVGNPRDIAGKPDLKIAAVSSEQRLKQFPNVPTFGELGAKGLNNEVMWRGFAVKKETPEAAVKWYQDLVQKVTDDPEWRKFWEPYGIKVVNYKSDKFNSMVSQDIKEFKEYLGK